MFNHFNKMPLKTAYYWSERKHDDVLRVEKSQTNKRKNKSYCILKFIFLIKYLCKKIFNDESSNEIKSLMFL